MRVEVKLEGVLAAHVPVNPCLRDLPEGADLEALVTALGLAPEEVVLAFVDGEPAAMDTPLKDGAKIALCPVLTGG